MLIQTLFGLQKLLQEKLDLASQDVLRQASALQDPETMNLQKVYNNDMITLCMWGNLSKNPRYMYTNHLINDNKLIKV